MKYIYHWTSWCAYEKNWSVGKERKGYKMANTLIGQLSPPCHQSHIATMAEHLSAECMLLLPRWRNLTNTPGWTWSFIQISCGGIHTFINTWIAQMACPSALHHHCNPGWCIWSAGMWGVFGNLWLQWKWPPEWQSLGMMAKGLVQLCSMGSTTHKTVSAIPMRQPKPSKQRFMLRQDSNICNYWEFFHSLQLSPTLTCTLYLQLHCRDP